MSDALEFQAKLSIKCEDGKTIPAKWVTFSMVAFDDFMSKITHQVHILLDNETIQRHHYTVSYKMATNAMATQISDEMISRSLLRIIKTGPHCH